MKRRVTMVLLLALSLVAFSQFGCQPAGPETNRSAVEPNTNSSRETVDTASIERELLRIENDWPRVVKEKDVEAVRRVEADDLVFIYPDGSLGNKEQDIKDMQSGALSADSWEVTDLKITVLDNDAAFASGRSVVKGGKYKGPDGKSVDISGEYRFIDTFARRDGQWKLVAGASVPVKQPTASASPAAKVSPAAMAPPAAKMSPAKKAPPAMTSTP